MRAHTCGLSPGHFGLRWLMPAALLFWLLLPASVVAGPEIEPNNTFGTRQLVMGPGVVSGSLSPGDVDFFRFSGLNPTAPYFLSIPSSNIGPLLGLFDNGGNLIEFSTGLLGVRMPDPLGNFDLGVSGFGDTGFTGAHGETGNYDLAVLGLIADLDGTLQAGATVPFLLSGLTPGSPFAAVLVAPPFRSVLGQVDGGGNILATGGGTLQGTVPANGNLQLVVSGFPDFGLTGLHAASGSFQLQVFGVQGSLPAAPPPPPPPGGGATVPEPLGLVLFSLAGCAGLVCARWRKMTAATT